MDLGRVGIWWSGSWAVSDAGGTEAAAEMEDLGYSTLWSSGAFEPGVSEQFSRLLSATRRAVVASGIISIWPNEPAPLALAVSDLQAKYGDRFLLGLGASHQFLVPDYQRPYSRMVGFLDGIDAASPSVPTGERMLAALGPRMLALAKNRSVGAHPYFVPAEHTAWARQILGDEVLLAPEATVVLERDPAKARELARGFTALYLAAPNYANNLRRFGFGDEDVADGGSDRLVDAVIGWGDVDAVATHVRRHFEAGADHVCVQVVAESRGSFPLAQYRELAPALMAAG
jgi:probable F420-dependent oxidoreductase